MRNVSLSRIARNLTCMDWWNFEVLQALHAILIVVSATVNLGSGASYDGEKESM